IGWLMHRTLGGVTAGALFILPGTICMMAMSYGYVAGGKSNLAEALFYGLKPAVLVIVVQSLVRVGRRFLRSRLMLLLSAAAFVAISGWQSVFSRIAILFSEVSFLWVGGPYAVNSYVAVDAVETYGWLTRNEVLDGLALAELAPGSAAQFLQFVGFVAAYRNPGMLNPHVAAAFGGL